MMTKTTQRDGKTISVSNKRKRKSLHSKVFQPALHNRWLFLVVMYILKPLLIKQ